MNLKKPDFWDYKRPNIISNLLYPFSKIVSLISSNRKNGIKVDGITTICVGNIYIGGTGKTSLAIEIKKNLDDKKVKSCFIKKYYKDQIDEQKLLQQHGDVIIDNSRLKALKIAFGKGYKIAIFDDGLQDDAVNYDLKIVCFNKKNLFGNQRVIPSGPLRENLDNIKKYKNVFLIGNDEKLENKILYKFANSNLFEASYKPHNIHEFKNQKYIVFSGIGNHHTFIDMLKKNNLEVIKDYEFPDHYNYKKKELEDMINESISRNCNILTTEKDYLRLPIEFNNNIKPIKIRLHINKIDELKKLLDEIIF